MRIYKVDIEVRLSVCAHNEDEAKQVCMEQFQKGKYVRDGVIVRCDEYFKNK